MVGQRSFGEISPHVFHLIASALHSPTPGSPFPLPKPNILVPIHLCMNSTPLLGRLGRVRIHRPLLRRARRVKIQPQLPPIKLPTLQHIQRLLRALDVRKVRVRKAARLARSPVNGHAHVRDVRNAAEQVVEVLVRHLKRHVADEERSGGRVLAAGRHLPRPRHGVLHDDATAFVRLHVHRFDGLGGAVWIVELDVAKSDRRASF